MLHHLTPYPTALHTQCRPVLSMQQHAGTTTHSRHTNRCFHLYEGRVWSCLISPNETVAEGCWPTGWRQALGTVLESGRASLSECALCATLLGRGEYTFLRAWNLSGWRRLPTGDREEGRKSKGGVRYCVPHSPRPAHLR